MKVLFVRPHVHLATAKWLQTMLLLEPYAQELLAAVVTPPDEVRICDLAVERNPEEAYAKTLREYRPDLIGFGGFSGQFHLICGLAATAKATIPGVITVIGGIHASSMPEDCKRPELFDLVVRGDGVSAMKLILAALAAGTPFPATACILPPASPDFDRLAATPPPPLHRDGIETRPRRDLVDMSKYFCICYGQPGQRMPTLFPRVASVRTSVGCPNRCRFCVVHFLANGKYLQREVEDVVDEIAALPQEYIYFLDDETFINAARMRHMAELLMARGIRKRYLTWARSDTVCEHPDLFALWKQAGLEFVYIGFESLEEKNLADYNKKATAAQNRRAREILRSLEINIHAAFMVNPDFDKEDFLAIQRAVREMAPAEFAFTVYSPPPGTPEFHATRDRFICPDPCKFYDGLHTLLPTKLPLKVFYRYVTILYGMGAARIPTRVNRVKIPFRDLAKFLLGGAWFGWSMYHLYRDYDRQHWHRQG